MRWSETDLAYFAGLLDGEGSFCLHDFGTHRFGCGVAIGNTDIRMLEWVKDRFGGFLKAEKRNNPRHKPIWRWTAEANTLPEMLTAILPYLIVKREQALNVLELRKSKEDPRSRMRGGPRGRPMPQEVLDVRQALYERGKALNAERG